MRKQIETQLPVHLRALALGALEACKDVRTYFKSNSFLFTLSFPCFSHANFYLAEKAYKDACDRIFFSTKCVYEFNPEEFMFP